VFSTFEAPAVTQVLGEALFLSATLWHPCAIPPLHSSELSRDGRDIEQHQESYAQQAPEEAERQVVASAEAGQCHAHLPCA